MIPTNCCFNLSQKEKKFNLNQNRKNFFDSNCLKIWSFTPTKTTSIFLESAFFNPISVRKSAKHHNLSTDSSYRFERGVDPNISKYALKRAVLMIKEVSKDSIVSSDLIDQIPHILRNLTWNLFQYLFSECLSLLMRMWRNW